MYYLKELVMEGDFEAAEQYIAPLKVAYQNFQFPKDGVHGPGAANALWLLP